MKEQTRLRSLYAKLFLVSLPALTLASGAFCQTPATMTDLGPGVVPTLGPVDVAQLLCTVCTNAVGTYPQPDANVNYYTDNGVNHGYWAGQTFTTGTNAGGYQLTSISIETSGLSDGGSYQNPGRYHLYLYSVSGGVATLIADFADSTNSASFTDGDWIQWTNLTFGSNPVELMPNTTYAYGFGRDATASGYAALSYAAGNPYPGGELAMLPTDGGAITFGASRTTDGTFAIGLSTNFTAGPPQIITQPVSMTVYSNAPVGFSVQAQSTAPMSFQWLLGNSPLPGQTNATLSIAHATLADAGNYTVVITNIYGATTSSGTTLTVSQLPATLNYGDLVIADGAVGYWPLDLSANSSQAVDLTTNGNFGTYNGITAANEVSGPSSYLPNAVSFNGTDANVDLSPGANTSVLQFGGPITMEAWVKPSANQVNSFGDIIAKGYDGSNGSETQMRVDQSPGYAEFNAGAGSWAGGFGGASYAPVTTNWTYVVSTYDGANWNLYINGALVDQEATGVVPLNFTDPWAIGAGTSGGAGRMFTGDICQVALYPNALTPAQVYLHYLAGEEGGGSTLPPLISRQPANEEAYVGGQGTFTVGLAGVAPYYYQWYQVIGGTTNAIAGATNATYTTPPTTAAMNGDGYVVDVTDSFGHEETSSMATLTVNPGSPDVISVKLQLAPGNYFGGAPDQTFLPTDAAGLYSATNWNTVQNLQRYNAGPEVSSGLVDENGFSTPIQLNVSGAVDGWSISGFGAIPDTSPVTKLFNTFIKGGSSTANLDPMTLTFTNMDDSKAYDAYVFLWNDNGLPDNPMYPNIDAGTGVTNYAGAEFNGTVNSNTVYIPSVNQDPNGTRDQGDFVRIVNVTPVNGAITITVNRDPSSLGNAVGVCGVQLVATNVDRAGIVLKSEPSDQRVLTNSMATLSVGAFGIPLPSYQWYAVIGGVTNPIVGATSASYTTAPVQDSNTGDGYFVVITNSVNTVTSRVAIVTAGHLVKVSGYLAADEYFAGYANNFAAMDALNPSASLSLPAPDRTEYLGSFNDNADLPGNGGERIWGWFTPKVTGNYVFYVASDDASQLWLSTDSDPANAYEIAQNQDWMDARDWVNSDTNSGESSDVLNNIAVANEWRSDGFETNGPGNGSFVYDYGTWLAWPNLNADGSITLNAGTAYYIELDHYQGSGGQNAGVTFKLTGNPDPTPGASTVLTGASLSTMAMDGSVVVITNEPADVSVTSGTTATFSVGAMSYVAGDAALPTPPIGYQWYMVSGGTTNAIPGATGASYTTPSTASVDSGEQFYCVVSTVGMETNSSLATLTVAAAQPQIASVRLSGGNLIFSGANGASGGTYYVLTSTNLALPVSQWTPIATNQFDSSGDFTVTNSVTSGSHQRFYLLQVP